MKNEKNNKTGRQAMPTGAERAGAADKAAGKPEKKPMSLVALILWCVGLLIAPEIYLLLCGLIFDTWLNLFQATIFIACSVLLFWAVDIVIAAVLVVRYIKAGKNRRRGR